MANRIVEALASSSAHGISRAAAVNSILLRISWIAFFLCFFGLFCHNARELVDKIINVSIMTTSETNKVPFKVPDLYFCPTNPISGSHPYTLNDTEAALVNNEIKTLGNIYDSLQRTHADKARGYWNNSKTVMILKSLSPNVMHLLFKKPGLSLLHGKACNGNQERSYSYIKSLSTTLMYRRNLCFKVEVSEQFAKDLKARIMTDPMIQLCLFTDTYNPQNLYNDKKIKPIQDGKNTIPIQHWHLSFNHYEDVTASGFTLYLVPAGHFPSTSETSVKLSPGRAYDIAIRMEEVAFSEELHNRNCSSDNATFSVVDPLTDRKIEYRSTLPGKTYEIYIKNVHRKSKLVFQDEPIPWGLRDSGRWNNLKDYRKWKINSSELMKSLVESRRSPEYYQSLQPCQSLKYRVASLSSHKWPTSSGYTRKFNPAARIQSTFPVRQPARLKGNKLAKKLFSYLYDPNTSEETDKKFLTDTMLKVSIRAQSEMSPRILKSYSYCWTSFLSDIGGLLGLYIGCSMLTVCELFELLYHLACVALECRKRRGNQQSDDQELRTTVATRASSSTREFRIQ